MGPSNPDEPLHSQPVQHQTAGTSPEPALCGARLSHLHLAAPKPTTTQLNRTASRRQGPVISTTVRQCRTAISGPLTAPAGGCDCSPAGTTAGRGRPPQHPLRCRCPLCEVNRRIGLHDSNGVAHACDSDTRCSRPSSVTYPISKPPTPNGSAARPTSGGNAVTGQHLFAASGPNPGSDSQPKSGRRKIRRNLSPDVAT